MVFCGVHSALERRVPSPGLRVTINVQYKARAEHHDNRIYSCRTQVKLTYERTQAHKTTDSQYAPMVMSADSPLFGRSISPVSV